MLFFYDGTIVALQGLAALGFGLALLRRRGSLPSEDLLLFGWGIGYLALSLITFIVAILGMLFPAVVLSLWAVGIVCLAFFLRPLQPAEHAFWNGLCLPRSFLLLFIVAAIANLLFSHAPPVLDDSVNFYLFLSQSYAKAHGLIHIPENHHNYLPGTVEMLYTQLLTLSSGEAAKLLHWTFGVLSAWISARIAWKHLHLRRLGLAVACFYTMPWVASLSGTGKIDLASLFFALLACHALLLWYEEPKEQYLLLCAAMCGAHFATKYTGLAMMATLSMAVLIRLRTQAGAVRRILRFGVLAIFPILPWLIRNIILKGNPIYPTRFPGSSGDPYLYAFLHSTGAKSWTEYCSSTFNNLVYGDLIWGTGPLLCAMGPILFLSLLRGNKPALKRIISWGVCSLVLCGLMFPGVMSSWYVAPALALLSLAVAAWMDDHWESLGLPLRNLIWLSLLFPSVLFSLYVGAKRLPFNLGLESREEFLAKNWSLPQDYSVYRFILQHVPKDQKILFAYQHMPPGYLYPDHHVLGFGAYPPQFHSLSTSQTLRVLQEQGIRYLLADPHDCVYTKDGTCCNQVIETCLHSLNFGRLSPALRLLIQGNQTSLYEIKN